MTDVTRRGFVKNSAGAAAGVTAVGALLAQQADAHEGQAGSDPVVAYVSDPRKGEVTLMAADREVTVHDRDLTARIVRAAH